MRSYLLHLEDLWKVNERRENKKRKELKVNERRGKEWKVNERRENKKRKELKVNERRGKEWKVNERRENKKRKELKVNERRGNEWKVNERREEREDKTDYAKLVTYTTLTLFPTRIFMKSTVSRNDKEVGNEVTCMFCQCLTSLNTRSVFIRKSPPVVNTCCRSLLASQKPHSDAGRVYQHALRNSAEDR
jgi:hypothetical protein